VTVRRVANRVGGGITAMPVLPRPISLIINAEKSPNKGLPIPSNSIDNGREFGSEFA
jgi:hypothetical protein